MSALAWFIAGTDTGVGKTLVTQALLHRLRERYRRVAGMKPIAAGADSDGLNEDVRALQAASSFDVPPSLLNPYALRSPVSPHIAAQRDGVVIDIPRIVAACDALRAQADAVLVEGAGGFRVPLSASLDGGDLAVALGLPVVLVVGLRLGCLNHALLTAEAIAMRGLTLAGWVGNCVDAEMVERQANIDLLATRLNGPCLGVVPHQLQPDVQTTAAHLAGWAVAHPSLN
jgi:dethiobiotin synthetase